MRGINNYFMNKAHIKEVLDRTNFVLQPYTYTKVAQFLENDVGIMTQSSEYQILAAFALISQVQKIKAVDNSKDVSTGIHLQSVMKHSGKCSKQKLLQEVIRQSQKWREAPLWLKAKIDSVNIAYRIYKKYRTLFLDLSQKHSSLNQQCQIYLMSIFWLDYLFIKNSHIDPNALECTKILECLFKFVFGELISNLDSNQIKQAFEIHFTNSEPLQSFTYQNYKIEILQLLRKIHQEERGVNTFNLSSLISQQSTMIRFLDDIDNNYVKFMDKLPQYSVDQRSFNELQKIVTPLPPRSPIIGQVQAISQKINFYQDQDERNHSESSPSDEPDIEPNMEIQYDNSMHQESKRRGKKSFEGTENKNTQNIRVHEVKRKLKPISPPRTPQNLFEFQNGTPLTVRNQNLIWVKKLTQINQRQNITQIKFVFEASTSLDYASYQRQVLDKISRSINHFTPNCQDKLNRQKSIYYFFAYLFTTIINKYQQQERQNIFNQKSRFNAIACLANNLYNYAYQNLQSSYSSYCQVYEVGIVTGLMSINWLRAATKMPNNILFYLQDVERKIMVQELWQGDKGYLWLSNRCKIYQGQSMFKNISLHTDYRTQQFCQTMKLSDKQSQKAINLMRFILQNRQKLLSDHSLDQTIFCAITSIIGINRSEKLLQSSSIPNNIFYDKTGLRIDILSNYNTYFLPQVEEIIYDQSATNILSTPVRLEMRKQRQQSTPFTVPFTQFSSGKKKVKTEKLYRDKIVQIIQSMDLGEIDEQNAEELPQTPYSGGMSRSMSDL